MFDVAVGAPVESESRLAARELAPSKPFLKWPGGKESELALLEPFYPHNIDRYFEPFLGGGAAYFAAPARRFVVNDRSEDLMAMYRCIAARDAQFEAQLDALSQAWDATGLAREVSVAEAVAASNGDLAALPLVRPSVEVLAATGIAGLADDAAYAAAVANGLKRKLKMVRASGDDAGATMALATAIKAALYTQVRSAYNAERAAGRMSSMRAVAFFFLREFCYSSMFRFSSKGDFNVPFGGYSYGRKSLVAKIAAMRSPTTQARFAQTHFHCGDFAAMLAAEAPSADDFIFVDPPYDSVFSTYDNNCFEGSDQQRLADALKSTPARFMLVVKNTPLMQQLYGDSGLVLLTYGMQYSVSFMNRNERDVEHLMVLNYQPPAHLLATLGA